MFFQLFEICEVVVRLTYTLFVISASLVVGWDAYLCPLGTFQLIFTNYAIMGAGISEWPSLINTTDLITHAGLSKI